MFTTGAFFGAAIAGPTGDYLGRRGTIVVGSIIFCLGGGLQTGAQNIHYLWAGRFLAGLGVGFLVMVGHQINATGHATNSLPDCANVSSRTRPPKYSRPNHVPTAAHAGCWRLDRSMDLLRHLCRYHEQ